jgi:hypothetical protein
MQLCPVCDHGMQLTEVRPDQAFGLFSCPQCHYIKTAQLLLSSNSQTGKKPCLFGITGYGRRATNRGKDDI